MYKGVYSVEDGGVRIVVGAKKENIELFTGPLTEQEYKDHVIEKCVPQDAINYRQISDEDIPREHIDIFEAWVDVTPESRIDVSCERARDIFLERLRKDREWHLEQLDKEMLIELERGRNVVDIARRKQILRDITEPLKAIECENVYNDDVLISSMRDFARLHEAHYA